MTQDEWSVIRESIEKVTSGHARRIDTETTQVKVSVYKVQGNVRCDVSFLRSSTLVEQE